METAVCGLQLCLCLCLCLCLYLYHCNHVLECSGSTSDDWSGRVLERLALQETWRCGREGTRGRVRRSGRYGTRARRGVVLVSAVRSRRRTRRARGRAARFFENELSYGPAAAQWRPFGRRSVARGGLTRHRSGGSLRGGRGTGGGRGHRNRADRRGKASGGRRSGAKSSPLDLRRLSIL